MSASDGPRAADDFVGPELPNLWRRLTSTEARDYERLAHLSPDEAAPWADALIGPYETARFLKAGRSLADAIADRDAQRAQRSEQANQVTTTNDRWRAAGFANDDAAEWERVGFDVDDAIAWIHGVSKAETHIASDDDLVLETGPHVLAFGAEEGAAWSKVGLVPELAAAWALAGVEPSRVASVLSEHDGPASYLEGLVETHPGQIMVWGTEPGGCQLATLPDLRAAAAFADGSAARAAVRRTISW